MTDKKVETHKRGGLLVEYAKSGRSACKACNGLISQDSMRIGQETPSGFHDGFDTNWYHYSCCNKKYSAPSFSSITEIRDWETLRWKDQLKIKKDIGEKIEDNENEKRRERENNALWDLIDSLDGTVKGPALKAILEANGMEVKKMTASRILYKVADGMLFGLIGPCPECKSAGSLRYNSIEYFCKTGWISAFTRCEFRGTNGVERYKFTIPADIKKNAFFKSWKPPKGFDHPTKTGPSAEGEEKSESGGKEEVEEEEQEEVDDGTPEEEVPDGLEMWGMSVVIAGTKKDLGMNQDDLIDLIRQHGGEVYEDVEDFINFMIAPEAEITKKKKTKKVTAAVKANLPVLSVEYVQNLCERKEKGVGLRKKDAAKEYLVGDTEFSDDKPLARKYTKAKYEKEQAKIAKEEADEGKEEEEVKERVIKRKRPEPKSDSDIMKVEPTSTVANKGEILVTYDDRYGYTPYNVMLNVADMTTGANKYYKMQIIKTKGKNSWTFLIKYGRIGTDAGDQKEYPRKSEKSAIEQFTEKFLEKTGVAWEDRDIFQKKPGKYFMVDIDDGHEDEEDDKDLQERKQKRQKKEEETKMDVDSNQEEMPKRLQDFVKTIFDKQMMQKTLESMNFDVKKMPLGKIKKAQIRDGYQVLTEIQNLLESKEDPTKMNVRLKDCANRFYTLIPHDFGRAQPPLIDDVEQVKKKMQLLDTLTDLEVAASLMKETVEANDPVLQNYKSLKSKISPLEKNSDRYKLLESYALSTHDNKYFSGFTFSVEDIFEIERDGERSRFDNWKDNSNKMLLWHGSRLTNWVGIISQGLRIAPPEAPKTGYRFGKGVYFADCISKSASYCFTSNDAPTGVMLLAEVALGKPAELKQDEYMEKPKPGCGSTKALGQFAPNTKEYQKIEGIVVPDAKVTVPVGKIVSTGISSACSHNEYIIYDVSQITIRYLLKLKFNHKGFGW